MLGSSRKLDNKSAATKTVERRTLTRRSEDYFWLLRVTEVTGDCALVIDAQMQIEFIDPRLLTMLEIDAETAETISDFSDIAANMAERGCFGKGDPKAFQAFLWDLLTNQRLKQARASEKISGITPSGQHIEITLTYGRDDRFILLFSDITDEWVEDQVIKTALDLGDSGYWHFNLDTREGFINAQSLKPLLEPDVYQKVKEDGLSCIIHPDDSDDALETVKRTSQTGQAQTGIFRIVDKNGENHWIRSRFLPGVDQRNRTRIVTGFFTNITEERKIQEDIKIARESAESALETRNAFLGIMSHEIRTPMNAVIGLTDAIIHQKKYPELDAKLILVQESAEKVVRLVEETLQHTKLENKAVELNPRQASPRKVAETVRDLWEASAKKNGTSVSCTIAPTVPKTMMFDDFRYEQCLNNLVGNAVKFTKNGQIQIILTTQGEGAAAQLILAVRDTGIGMTEPQQKSIFEAYKQADNTISSQYGGTGLGLSITKTIVKMMDGRITVKSEPGKGTIFAVAIPIQARPAQKTQEAAAPKLETLKTAAQQTQSAASLLPEQSADMRPALDANDNNLRAQTSHASNPDEGASESRYSDLDILIVDDNATNHLVVGSLLENVVGKIETAMNGEEAIAALDARAKSDKPLYDLVLMDIHMPVMDGIEATLAIRSTPSDYDAVPIIALTADPQYQQSRLCKNIGMNEALAKPIKLKQLLDAFDIILDADAAAVAA